MADIINNIGAGQTYTTVSAWWAARQSADNWIGNYVDTDTINVGELAGTNAGGAELRADQSVAYNFDSPTDAHPTISAAGNPIYIRATNKFILRGFEVTNTTTLGLVVRAGSFEDCDLEVRECSLSGGLEAVGTSRVGAKIHLENCVVRDTDQFGIRGASIGVTGTHVAVVNCNLSDTNFRAGIQTTAGSAWDSVVVFNSFRKDWLDTNGTCVNCASGDTTAFGSNTVTGVVDGDFTNSVAEIWTAAAAGALEGTGSGGTNIGLNLIAANVVIALTPVEATLFQRDSNNQADILITGTYSGPTTPTAIEASFNGGGFVTIDGSPAGGTYSGTLSNQAAGNGDLIVRFTNDTGVNTTNTNIAIGIKILFWGQSNLSGRATNAQTYTGTAGFFHKYTVTNDLWEIGGDPFDTDTANGSLFPLLANLLVAEIGVPVAFIGVASGSTTLSQWQSGQTLNTRMLDYLTSSGGNDIEGIASWIGESDANAGTIEATFKSEYNSVIDQLETLTGIKSVLCGIAQVSAASDNVRQWIQDIVASNANALEYVDMAAEYSGIHYTTDQETADVAQALFDSLLIAYINSVIGITLTGIPDGAAKTVLVDITNIDLPVILPTQLLTYSSGTASASVPVVVGSKIISIETGNNPKTTGGADYGVTT